MSLDAHCRTRRFKRIEGFGGPVQKSVFERALDKVCFAVVEDRCFGGAVADGDLVRCYRLCGRCRERTVIIGEGQVTQQPEATVL